ncbi:MAG: HEAT repeat domain-containing protein, partial [Deltaproteobacteria bacterium]|nr:HEAT repeat domain-containing protein [Deltaproteobacteria bacterium]
MRPYALLATVLLLPGAATADERYEYLTEQLAKAKDPRVKAQTALLLGTLGDARAVGPLCGQLKDPSPIARSAAAKALGKLRAPAGSDCLNRHKSDADASTKAEINQALASIKAASKPARYYLALGTFSPKGLDAKLAELARTELRGQIEELGGLVAPPNEPKSAASAVLRERKIKGFRINVVIEGQASGA